ncbi:hypothetical protein [Methylobacterium sp. WL1]|uniref:hypothetical protein n=1 Tax=Methylobacterium sp. WL1 TaxID=2603276 RepID=UPI001FEF8834|nr:hypothetical protein [Methylobacterium sp. WL1]
MEIDDPLREGRLQALVAEELAKAGAQAKAPASSPATLVGGSCGPGPSTRFRGRPLVRHARLRPARRPARCPRAPVRRPGPPRLERRPPAVQLGFTGSLAAPERVLDVGALSNGLAAFVLQRELDTIELTEADQVERQRRRARIEMDRARAAALKAAADKAAAEDAARRARVQSEGEATPGGTEGTQPPGRP